MNPQKLSVIIDRTRSMWWRADCRGYTPNLLDAGVYTPNGLERANAEPGVDEVVALDDVIGAIRRARVGGDRVVDHVVQVPLGARDPGVAIDYSEPAPPDDDGASAWRLCSWCDGAWPRAGRPKHEDGCPVAEIAVLRVQVLQHAEVLCEARTQALHEAAAHLVLLGHEDTVSDQLYMLAEADPLVTRE